MKILVVLTVMSMLMQGLAYAATGHKAQLATTVEFGEEMIAMIEAMASMGSDEGHAAMEEMEPVEVIQTVYWSEAGMRMETAAEAGVEATVIYDYVNGLMYQFTSAEPVATKMEIEGMAGDGAHGMGGPDAMGMFLDWESAISGMQDQEHMIVNELAERTVAGLPCRGVSFTMDIEALMAEHSDSATEGEAGMAMGMMGAMGNIGGEVWVNEGLGFPVLVEITAMGSTVSMAMSQVEEWVVNEAMLAVPDGYEIKEFEMPDIGDWAMPEDHTNHEGH